jgi:hypothetical protein
MMSMIDLMATCNEDQVRPLIIGKDAGNGRIQGGNLSVSPSLRVTNKKEKVVIGSQMSYLQKKEAAEEQKRIEEIVYKKF